MKSAYYTALVTNAYRIAIDSYFDDPDGYRLDESLMRELESVSHREYCTGYYLGLPSEEAHLCTDTGYIRDKAYFAAAPEDLSSVPLPENIEFETENGRLYPFIQRNKVKLGDIAEVISPGKIGRAFTVTELYSESGEALESAPHPRMVFFIRIPFDVSGGDIMRAGD